MGFDIKIKQITHLFYFTKHI